MAQAEKGGEFTFSYKRFKRQGTSMETKRTTLKLRLDAGVMHGTTRTLKVKDTTILRENEATSSSPSASMRVKPIGGRATS